MAEVNPTLCSVAGCSKAGRARGWCSTHYMRWRKHGDPSTTVIPKYEDDTCSVEGCTRPRKKRGWCAAHYMRWHTHGDPLGGRPSYRVCQLCEVQDCGGQAVSRGLCKTHYARLRRNGTPSDEALTRPVWEEGHCARCGEKTGLRLGYRKWCSDRCRGLSTREAAVEARRCTECGDEIDYSQVHPSGRVRYRNASRCHSCRRNNVSRHWKPVRERDGDACHLCGSNVDFTLKFPSPLSRSMDHVVPRSLGGSDTLDNLKLAHLACNIRRQNRPL